MNQIELLTMATTAGTNLSRKMGRACGANRPQSACGLTERMTAIDIGFQFAK